MKKILAVFGVVLGMSMVGCGTEEDTDVSLEQGSDLSIESGVANSGKCQVVNNVLTGYCMIPLTCQVIPTKSLKCPVGPPLNLRSTTCPSPYVDFGRMCP